MTTEFSVSCRTNDDGSFVVIVVGDLDVATVPAFREFLLALDGEVELDCSELAFIDSVGLGELVRYYNRLGTTGRHLRLTNVSDSCWRVLELTGLTGLLNATRAVRDS